MENNEHNNQEQELNKNMDDQLENSTKEDQAENDGGEATVNTTESQEEKAPSPEDALTKLQTQHTELKDKYIRLLAEFDNFKKRKIKERIELMNTAAQDTLTALLPILDDFDRAKKNAVDNNTEQLFNEGIGLVHQKLITVLNQRGLKAMETTGEQFDPELHEAFAEIPAPSEDMKGKVVDTIEKGYLLKEKIIRHAKVVVGK